MTDQHNSTMSLRLCTFNCRSVKSSINEIRELCNNCDILFLQEHWLLPTELILLSSLHADFVAIAKSAVDISADILQGRPYGGTSIIYRKQLMHAISGVETLDSRLCAIELKSSMGPILLICVYMPTDMGDLHCYENYVATCANITALYSQYDTAHVVIIGDFNCSLNSRFSDVFS